MDRSRRCGLMLAVLALSLTLSAPVSAQNRPPSYADCHEMNRLLHWSHFPVRVYFTPSSTCTLDRRKQVLAGFDEWVDATQGTVSYQVIDASAEADLTVAISSQVSLPKSARALGQTVLTYEDTRLTKAVLQLVERDDDPAQFQEICAHEFGHALGIDGHSDNSDDMMFPVLSHSLFQVGNPELDWLCSPGTITARDVNTLAAAYPALVFPPKKH